MMAGNTSVRFNMHNSRSSNHVHTQNQVLTGYNQGYNSSSGSNPMQQNGIQTTTSHFHDISDPLFTRQGTTNDEFQELVQCRNMRDNLQQEVIKLQKINVDLETLLERQAKQSLAVETECINIERKWAEKCTKLEREIYELKALFDAERSKGDRVREQLSRTERELYGIFQRKYQMMKGPGGATGASIGVSSSSTATNQNSGSKQLPGPNQFFPGSLLSSNGKSSEQFLKRDISGIWDGENTSYENDKVSTKANKLMAYTS